MEDVERNIDVTCIARHETEDVARVDYEEDGIGRHEHDTQRAPLESLNKALDALAPHLAACYLIEPGHHGKIRIREVRLSYPEEGGVFVKLYGQIRPDPHSPERFPLRSKKDEAKGALLRSVNRLISLAVDYVNGDRQELLTDGIQDAPAGAEGLDSEAEATDVTDDEDEV